MQTLQVHNTSAQVTIPKDDLRRDGVIDENFPEDFEQNVVVDRMGRGVYMVRLVNVENEAQVPDLLQTDVVKRAAAQLMLDDNHPARLSAD